MSIEELIIEVNKRIKELSKPDVTKNDKLVEMVKDEIKVQESMDNIYSYEKYLTCKKAISKLDKLIGLDDVKDEVKKLINLLIFYEKAKDIVKLDKINLHMVFRGNPGTGKTTVARIIAEVLCDLGYVRTKTVKETTPRDFIGEYIGQTAVKTKKLIDSVDGGIIFVDEAYGFSQNAMQGDKSFAPEAITEIIKSMESLDNVFIFAGYDNEMDKFINLNPGIKSRLGYDIKFKDYTTEELFQMIMNKMNKSGFIVSDDAKLIIKNIIDEKRNEENFGNGRMIDNLYNKIILEHANINFLENKSDNLVNITSQTLVNIKI